MATGPSSNLGRQGKSKRNVMVLLAIKFSHKTHNWFNNRICHVCFINTASLTFIIFTVLIVPNQRTWSKEVLLCRYVLTLTYV